MKWTWKAAFCQLKVHQNTAGSISDMYAYLPMHEIIESSLDLIEDLMKNGFKLDGIIFFNMRPLL